MGKPVLSQQVSDLFFFEAVQHAHLFSPVWVFYSGLFKPAGNDLGQAQGMAPGLLCASPGIPGIADHEAV